jgi:RNA polymerase-interacting CarD/CdnL/TRCF family regulator
VRFEVGDEVVVSGCGLGEVDAIESMSVDGSDTEMYRITFAESGFRTWIPTDRPEASARPIMSGDDAEAALEALASQEVPEKQANWRRRHLRYQQTVQDNDPQELAALLGELAALQGVKTLSFQERRLFDRLKHLVLPELAAARGVPATEIEAVLAQVLDAQRRAA